MIYNEALFREVEKKLGDIAGKPVRAPKGVEQHSEQYGQYSFVIDCASPQAMNKLIPILREAVKKSGIKGKSDVIFQNISPPDGSGLNMMKSVKISSALFTEGPKTDKLFAELAKRQDSIREAIAFEDKAATESLGAMAGARELARYVNTYIGQKVASADFGTNRLVLNASDATTAGMTRQHVQSDEAMRVNPAEIEGNKLVITVNDPQVARDYFRANLKSVAQILGSGINPSQLSL